MSLLHGPRVITDGLLLSLDAADRSSYSGVGTNFYDLSGNGNNTLLIDGPTFSNDYLGAIVLDGDKDYISGISSVTIGDTFTISMWLTYNSVPDTTPNTRRKRKKIRFGRGRIFLEDDCEDSPRRLKFYLDDSTEQKLWSWGQNVRAELGINNSTVKSTPVTVFGVGTEWEVISAGKYHNGAIKDNGTLWMWGFNTLGNNTGSQSLTPITTILGGTNWKTVSCGDDRSSAIKNNGTLWVWGTNTNGQLGVNDLTQRLTPVTTILGGTNWYSVSAGYNTISAIKKDGTLWIWGRNESGQLGVNDIINRSTPVTTIVGGTNWKSVDCGLRSGVVALKTDGTLWVWGLNDQGQLGINSFVSKSTPVTTILGGTNWRYIASDNYNIVTSKTDGTLWIWGRNSYGQLGVNDTTSRITPITTILGGTNWQSISCSSGHIASLKTDGTLWNWGDNQFGQLGINATTNRSTPITTILGGVTWKKISAGSAHSIAIKTNGTFTTDFTVDNSSVQTGVVYNIVGVWNGNTMTLYRNNVVVGTYPVAQTLTKTPLDFTISSPIEAFNGNIYNVMVYDSALSSSDIRQNFNALRGRFGI